MGNLFSRAIKRFTQCRNEAASQEQQEAAAAAQQPQQQHGGQESSRPTVQAITVGQSIDSAEYAAFEGAGEREPTPAAATATTMTITKQAASKTTATIVEEDEDEDEEAEERENRPIVASREIVKAAQVEEVEPSTPAVEEAVIKIQALVRGHLTRKALKDAQQQAATPAPNALGQSQFDEDSLIRNPPSAVFSCPLSVAPASLGNDPLAAPLTTDQAAAAAPAKAAQQGARVPPLESIAESVEVAAAAAAVAADPNSTGATQPHLEADETEATAAAAHKRRKASPIGRPAALSSESRADSISPAPSEATASIDLTCDTPASASIDILDHNMRPADTIATVLHHRNLDQQRAEAESARRRRLMAEAELEAEAEAETTPPPSMVLEPPQLAGAAAAAVAVSSGPEEEEEEEEEGATRQADELTNSRGATVTMGSGGGGIQNSHSIDSAEAAAIRIQSAFRGYHTRKHSPYRRRSPGGAQTAPLSSSSSPPRLVAMPASLDSSLSNGAGEAARRRSPLRQQPAAVALDDLVDELEEALELDAEEKEQQRANELDSDDLERRDPSGRGAGEDLRARSPPAAEASEAALASGGNSFEEAGGALDTNDDDDDNANEATNRRQSQAAAAEEEASLVIQGQLQQPARLAVESPDEAIGSGRSSPALVSSNGASGSSSEDEEAAPAAAAEEDLEGQAGQAGGAGGQQAGEEEEEEGARVPAGGRGQRKKNRNRKKGRK